MNGRNGFGQWQMSELARYLEKSREDPLLDSKTVFLANPKQKIELDGIIKEQLWPAVLDALAPTPIRVFDIKMVFPHQISMTIIMHPGVLMEKNISTPTVGIKKPKRCLQRSIR